MSGAPPVTRVDHPVRLTWTRSAGRDLSRFLRLVQERRLTGQRCPRCQQVMVPPRGMCPTCSVPTSSPELEVELAHTGTVTAFCVVNIPFPGQELAPPYVCASVRLDGADVSIFHMVGGCPPEAAHVGMRVVAVWRDPPLEPSLEAIRWFAPLDLP